MTLACVVRGGLLEAKEAAAYVAVQCLAAAAGAALAGGLYPFDEAAFPAPVEGVGLWTAVASEMDFTLAEPIAHALRSAVDNSDTGYRWADGVPAAPRMPALV